MTYTLKRIGILKFGIMLGVLYGLLGLIIAPIFSLAMIAKAPEEGSAPANLGYLVGSIIIPIIFLPIVYGFLGFILGVIMSFIYNLIAHIVGGIQIVLEESK